MRFELSVCLRYLAPKRGRLFISVSTLFSILGLALGVATYITVVAVMTGFRTQITSAYTGFYSDLIAYKEKAENGRRVFTVVNEDDLAVIRKAAAEVDGIVATSPFIYGKVNVHVNDLVYSFDLRGVDPKTEPLVSTILSEHRLEEGSFKFEPDGDYVAIVIGRQIADRGGLQLDDSVVISSTGVGTLGGQRITLNAYVAGIFSYGNIEQDLTVYTSLETAQILQGLGGGVHRVSIKVTDPEQADRIKVELKAKLEQVRRQSLLDDFQTKLDESLKLVDSSRKGIEAGGATFREQAAAANLDEEERGWVDTIAKALDKLPGPLAAAKDPIAAARGYGTETGFDDTERLKDAIAATLDVREPLNTGLQYTIRLEATLDEADPFMPALRDVEDALADASEAMRRANYSCNDMLFEPFQVVSWSELNPDLFSLVNQERIITAIFVAMIVVVAGFIIISGLSMTVVQKKREIGIMRAMGARSASVATIFGLSGLTIGLLGTALGTLLGLLVSENFNPIRDWVGRTLGFTLFAPYPSIPVTVQLVDLVVIWIFTMVWSVLVSIVPAISAARLDPAQALRWE